jgi:hypothetical protein
LEWKFYASRSLSRKLSRRTKKEKQKKYESGGSIDWNQQQQQEYKTGKVKCRVIPVTGRGGS